MKPSRHKNYTTKSYPGNPSVGKTNKEGLYYGFRGKYYNINKLRNFIQQVFPLLYLYNATTT
jgi:hypothetical protein